MTLEYYPNHSTFLIAVDCIIFGFIDKDLHILLTRRPVEPSRGEWSLMGGFMDGTENLEDAAKKVLFQYTQQSGVYMEQVNAYGNVDRDKGGRVVSVTYYALVNMNEFDTTLARKYDARWENIRNLPKLVFDHNKMVEDALTLLRFKISMQPIIFNFFKDKFTLPALQNLYEAIYQIPIDKRNFRKKIASMDILDKLEEKDKYSSKRGAHYYTFNEKKYLKYLKEGKRFSL